MCIILCCGLLRVGIGAPVSCTPDAKTSVYNRHLEVAQWLQCNKFDQFVVIDDLRMPQFGRHYVHVDPQRGLSVQNVQSAIQVLNSQTCDVTADELSLIMNAPAFDYSGDDAKTLNDETVADNELLTLLASLDETVVDDELLTLLPLLQ